MSPPFRTAGAVARRFGKGEDPHNQGSSRAGRLRISVCDEFVKSWSGESAELPFRYIRVEIV